jgi:hypothetical protein
LVQLASAARKIGFGLLPVALKSSLGLLPPRRVIGVPPARVFVARGRCVAHAALGAPSVPGLAARPLARSLQNVAGLSPRTPPIRPTCRPTERHQRASLLGLLAVCGNLDGTYRPDNAKSPRNVNLSCLGRDPSRFELFAKLAPSAHLDDLPADRLAVCVTRP